MSLLDIAQRLFVSILCGALIGLEREYVRQRERALFPGMRTMMLIALAGALAAHLSEGVGPWLVIAALLAVSALLLLSHGAQLERDPGLTTEVAGIVTFLIGVLIGRGSINLGVATAIVVTLILSLKAPLHAFARRISESDLHATLKFAIISFVVLPLLPDRAYGPFAVLNPYEIWLMVVLISGISFLGYVLMQLLGPKRGLVLAAGLGGLVSSTAVTLSAAQQSRQATGLAPVLAASVLLASAVMFPRVLVVLAVVRPSLIPVVALPLLGMAAAAMLACLPLLGRGGAEREVQPELRNPFALGAAFEFALIFATVSFVSKAAEAAYGGAGLYATALVSGLADVDAITLSVAKLVGGGTEVRLGGRAILLAMTANTAAKAGIVWFFGAPPMARRVLLGKAPVVGAGAAAFLLL